MKAIKSVNLLFLSIFFLLLLIFTPLLVNKLMITPSTYFGMEKVDLNNHWVGFFSSYLGGIFGGIISGALTLGGVYLTIKAQEKKDYINTYSSKIFYVHKIKKELDTLPILKNFIEKESFLALQNLINNINNKSPHILEYAAQVDTKFYLTIKELIVSIEKMDTFFLIMNEYFNQPKSNAYLVEEYVYKNLTNFQSITESIKVNIMLYKEEEKRIESNIPK
ncbi:hypothetical protein [Lysinibacillus fusiformis]|uniref:hypothetical protein n=1 Tax=Lysinibacillus fusiformis TaxID=28031 RepID=UPI0023A9F14B|nr:hypothetical protein [Lysinibacillus fusiformis]WEA41350.1 hypothetical protein PWJ66_10560 [Lysinibacillus fusiformis]